MVFPASFSLAEMPDNELDRLSTFYYLEPRPESIPEVIAALSRRGYLSNEKSVVATMAFLSRIFRKENQQVEAWRSSFPPLSILEKRTIWLALWYADTPETDAIIRNEFQRENSSNRKMLQKLMNQKPKAFEEMELDSTARVDMLWGAFLATGQEKFVIRVIEALPFTKVRGDSALMLVGGAARWSLISKASQHQRVMDICLEQMKRQPKEVKEILKEVIQVARAQNL